jgi:hypothetical protein
VPHLIGVLRFYGKPSYLEAEIDEISWQELIISGNEGRVLRLLYSGVDNGERRLRCGATWWNKCTRDQETCNSESDGDPAKANGKLRMTEFEKKIQTCRSVLSVT